MERDKYEQTITTWRFQLNRRLAYTIINFNLSPCNFTRIRTHPKMHEINCNSIELIALLFFFSRWFSAISTLPMHINRNGEKSN